MRLRRKGHGKVQGRPCQEDQELVKEPECRTGLSTAGTERKADLRAATEVDPERWARGRSCQIQGHKLC